MSGIKLAKYDIYENFALWKLFGDLVKNTSRKNFEEQMHDDLIVKIKEKFPISGQTYIVQTFADKFTTIIVNYDKDGNLHSASEKTPAIYVYDEFCGYGNYIHYDHGNIMETWYPFMISFAAKWEKYKTSSCYIILENKLVSCHANRGDRLDVIYDENEWEKRPDINMSRSGDIFYYYPYNEEIVENFVIVMEKKFGDKKTIDTVETNPQHSKYFIDVSEKSKIHIS